MRKKITKLCNWTGVLAVLLLSFSAFGQGPSTLVLQSVESVDETACGADDGLLKIYFSDASTYKGTYRLDCKFGDSRPASFEHLKLGKGLIKVKAYASAYSNFKLTRELDGVQSNTLNVTREVKTACNAIHSVLAESNWQDFTNCQGDLVSVDMDILQPNSFINLSDQGHTCIAPVDASGNIGSSFQTFCIDPDYPGPGSYDYGVLKWTKVIGLNHPRIVLDELQAERINWILCHSDAYTTDLNEINNAIHGVEGKSYGENNLYWAAVDAVPTVQGGIADKMEFFVADHSVQTQVVQTQVVGDCVPCNNVTDAGEIGSDQTVCYGEIPDLLTSISLPSGGSGDVEYVWLKNFTGPTTASGVEVISSNTPTYQPGPVTQDTWFRRCSRSVGCSDYNGESNWIKITPTNCAADPWNFSCASGKDVDIIGKGIKGKSFNAINFANSGEIYKIVVEVVYKGGNPGASINIADASGNSYTAYRKSVAGSSGAWVYRAILPSTSAVTYSVAFADKQNAQSMMAYAFRNISTATESSGVFIENGGYNNIRTFSIPINSASFSRDVMLEIPVSELTLDGRYLKISANAGSESAETIESITSLPDGCCYKSFNLTIPNVPGNVTSVDIAIDSRNYQNGMAVKGQSWVAAGMVKVTSNCNSCDDFTFGGEIGVDKEICVNTSPGPFTSISLPSGGSGAIEYQWMKRAGVHPEGVDNNWVAIAGANGTTYDPGILTETTTFVRCSNREFCDTWAGESNPVVITTIDCGNSINCIPSFDVDISPGESQVVATWNEPTGATNCPSGGLAISQTQGLPSGSLFSAGVHTIGYQVTDNCGLIATCSFEITVTGPPTGNIAMDCASLPDVNVTLTPGSTSQVINWAAPTATTTCSLGGLVVTQTLGDPSGTAFTEGTYTITYEANDACLASKECSFNITVNPAPTGNIAMDCASLPDVNVTLTPGSTSQVINWAAPTATTTCSLGGLVVTQTLGDPSGTAFTEGTYTITYEANDACLASKECSFNIMVNPAPTGQVALACNPDMEVTIFPGMTTYAVTWVTPTATTTCPLDGLTVVQTSGPASGDNLSAGTYTVTYLATDACLDTAECSFTILVNPPPTSEIVFACNSNIELTLTPGQSGVVVDWNAPTATTNCPLGSVGVVQVQGPTPGTELGPGTYTVVYQAFDGCFSQAMCSFDIVINPAPVGEIKINCNNDIITYVTPGTSSQVVVWDAPTGSTTCPTGGWAIEQTYGPVSGSELAAGTYTVVYNATDACGNTATCSFKIMVDDVVPCAIRDITPALDCNGDNPFNFYLKGMISGITGLGDYYAYESGSFVEYENGTAALKMVVKNINIPTAKLKLNLVFTGRAETTSPSPIPPTCFSTDFFDWYYYENISGYIEGVGDLSGAKLYATWLMHKTQLGTGANLYTDEFGMTAWLDLTIASQPNKASIQLSTQAYESDVHLALSGTTTDCSNTSELLLNCPTALRVSAKPGAVDATMDWSVPTATTTCNLPGVIVTQVSGPTPGSSLPINTFEIVKYRATDLCGNETFCSFSVAVSVIPSPVCANHEASNFVDLCGQGTPQFVTISNLLSGIDEEFELVSGSLTENTNNTAFLYASVKSINDPEIKFSFGLNLGGKVIDAPTGVNLNGSCYTLDDAGLIYYESMSGYILGEGKLAGGKLKVDSNSPFILGIGGSLNNETSFGGSVSAGLVVVDQPVNQDFVFSGSLQMLVGMELTGGLGDCTSQKPIFDLTASSSFGNSRLVWTNNTGQANAYFSIERSSDGITYNEIDRKESIMTNQANSYEYFDTNPLAGQNFYRVKAVQNSGLNLLSNEVELAFAGKMKDNDVVVGPVPTDDIIHIDFSMLDGQVGTVAIMDAYGMAVWSSNEMEFTKTPLELSMGNYTDGVYTLLVTVTNKKFAKVITKTIVLTKM